LSLFNLQSGSSKVIVTLFSRIIVALTGIVFVPIYVRIIGAESYGLVSFYGTLVGSLAILDLGLSIAISRQVAILRAQGNKEREMKDLVFSVEIIYWAMGLVLGLLIVLLAHPIAVYWVKAKDLPVHQIEKAIMLMGAVFAFQFPASIYNGVMIGMEKQIQNAVIIVIATILKAAGVIFVLVYVSPAVKSYFVWQALVSFLLIIFLRIYVWRKLNNYPGKVVFSVIQLKTIWHFAAGMAGLSLINFFLTQVDKIVVSKMVLLEFVGYYNLAFLLSTVINQVIAPIQPVIFPKFASMVAQNRQTELVALYHKSCRWVAIIVFPIGFTLILFAREILLLWTKNPTLTLHTAPILQVFAAGTICNCMLWIPYSYMLAKGNTRFTIYQNAIAAIILVPLLFWWTAKYGAIGASFVWLSVNAGYILITIPLFHRLFLKGELLNWYKKDVALPFLAAGLLALGAKYFQQKILPDISIVWFALLLLIVSSVYVVIVPELRGFLHQLKFKLKNSV
jgi:O-antigen/teichoic acid export membrane protein